MRRRTDPAGRVIALLAGATLVATLAGCSEVRESRRIDPSADPAARESPSVTITSSAPASPTPAEARAPRWRATGTMITPRAFHTATRLLDGTVLVTGGLVDDRIDGVAQTAAEVYDPATGAWAATGDMARARWGHTATLLPDGRVLVAGGYRSGRGPLASAELYNPANGTWTATGKMTRGRGGHTATLLPTGKVLVVGGGGEDDESEGGPRSRSAELFDPTDGTWTATVRMSEARKGFTATLLEDGSVLVVGGDTGFAAAERYDPREGTWTATGDLVDGRFGHTATRLPDGTVLAAGGCACSEPGALVSAELYDPARGSWGATADMHTARIFHTATLLAGGVVLVVDDGLAGDQPTSAELYHPETRKWTKTARPAVARTGYTATLLLDGTVLVTGDYDVGNPASELYDPGA